MHTFNLRSGILRHAPHNAPLNESPLENHIPPADDTLDALVLSDIHLGSDNCQAKHLAAFLQQILDGEIRIRQLVIAGDVFDSIDFRRLKKTHWKVLSLIRHLSDKIDIIWIAGNHDGSADIVSQLLGVTVVEHYILRSGSRRILIIHGHIFDEFIEHHPYLTWIADCGYFLLQKIDRTHYVARLAKSRSKTFIRCIDKIRTGAIALARSLDCDAAICGHTHVATDDRSQDVHYFNSGCWTENPAHYLTIHQGAIRLHRHDALAPQALPLLTAPESSTTHATRHLLQAPHPSDRYQRGICGSEYVRNSCAINNAPVAAAPLHSSKS